MNETEFRQVMAELASKYSVDQIDPMIGSSTWLNKHVKKFKHEMPSGVWNPVEARKYYLIVKKSIEDFVKNSPVYNYGK
jgi:hypothetical protein